ncbi:MAG: DUF1501 domain-containing protein [Verrucomicrobiae bacterium]|nr:DUF1501 domain-containing protein [Verrucomicrobiae bacterium]
MIRTTSGGEHPTRAGFSRRDFLRVSALGALGAGLTRHAEARAAGAPCRSVILLWMQGGMSHLDTFDPKPDAPSEIRGRFGVIPTNVPGIRLSEHMRGLAQVADKTVFIRSMHHPEGMHERGMSYMLSGLPPCPTTPAPSIGAIVSKELGPRDGVPPYVTIPGTSFTAALGCLGPGYLDAGCQPLRVTSDESGERFHAKDLRERWTLEALDLTKEPLKQRDAYGRAGIGLKCLLARRLVEAGVRFVTVDEDGWDHHYRAFDALERRLPAFDRAVSALIRDLGERGLLKTTMVLFMTEFGRTPRINREAGRDHWSTVFSVFAAGGGLRGGQVVGSSDKLGESPASNPITPEDLIRTVYRQLGIDADKRYAQTSLGRPMNILDGGHVIRELV